jgi:hypothetical protein
LSSGTEQKQSKMFHPCGCGSCTRFRSPFDVPAIIEKILFHAAADLPASEQADFLARECPGGGPEYQAGALTAGGRTVPAHGMERQRV